MGTRHPDRVSLHHRRTACNTVEQMLAQGWDIISKCDKCGLIMATDLALIIRVSGPGTILWNRRQPCRRLACGGWVDFMARPPGCSFHRRLVAEEPRELR